MDFSLQANGTLTYHYHMDSETHDRGKPCTIGGTRDTVRDLAEPARARAGRARSFRSRSFRAGSFRAGYFRASSFRAAWQPLAVIFCLAVAPLHEASAQDLRSPLFQAADAALAAADGTDASVLAPAAYEAGMNAYTAAENDLARGRSINRIQGRLADAEAAFNRAAVTAAAAAATFAPLLETRRQTLDARADVFAVELWNDAEAAFRAVSRRLESSPSADLGDRTATVESLYRDAELTAIKAQHLSQTRALLAQAALDRVPQYAPRTHASAEALLAQAEAALDADRYDVEPARQLAEQAAYEVRRAISMTRRVLELVDRDRTVEDLILEYEQGIAEIAAAAGSEARLDAGPAPLIADLVAEIETLRQRERQLQIDADENRIRIAGLEEEIRELDDQLGGVFRERVALVQQLEADERVRERFERIENLFAVDQAQVTREGDSVIVTLTGLTFASGSSQIDAAHAPLLEAVGEAVDVFPLSGIVVEGHTDSYGGAISNMSLSRSRAEAVGDYLSDRLGVAGERISSLGYGETRPVANNETAQGRARNRRIEVRITPQPTG